MRVAKTIALVFSLLVAAVGGYLLGTKEAAMNVFGSTFGKSASSHQAAATATTASASTSKVAVRVSRVESVALPLDVAAVGTLRSDESVVIRPEIAGRIVHIAFQEGRRVAGGTVLVRLDDSLQAADLEQARASLALAKAGYDRASGLHADGFISDRAKDEAENALMAARSTVAQAQARLAKTTIHAPFTGTLGLRRVSVGDYVKEGQDIVNLEAVDSMKVDFHLPEVYSTKVHVGQALHVSLDAVDGKTFEGTVSAINPLFDRDTRSIAIRATVVNREGKLRPGMFARVGLPIARAGDSLVIPESALIPESGIQYVSRIEGGKAVRVMVDIGRRREGYVEVLRGLSDGDTVVTEGQFKIKEGAAVRYDVPPGRATGPLFK